MLEFLQYRYKNSDVVRRPRSTMMWTIGIYGIMMCQHIDAWSLHQQEELQPLRTILFPQAANDNITIYFREAI